MPTRSDHPGRSQAVAVLHWPTEADRRQELKRLGIPRLLLVEGASHPPVVEANEDWARLPIDDDDLRARVERLVQDRQERPTLDEFGVLTVRTTWVALPPLEEMIVLPLLRSFGTTVSRADLTAEVWPEGNQGHRALDTKIHRLRGRIAPLGLAIHTVRRRGFVLDWAPAQPTVPSGAEEPTWPIS